jgi:hypothetical protein
MELWRITKTLFEKMKKSEVEIGAAQKGLTFWTEPEID